MNYSDAVRKAKKLGIPAPNQYVRMPVEVGLAFIDVNNLEVLGWRGEYLVVRRKPVDGEQKAESSRQLSGSVEAKAEGES